MKKRELLGALFFFLLITTLFYNKVILKEQIPFPGDHLVSFYSPWQAELSWPSKNQGADVVRQLYPWKALSIYSIKEKQLPFWNPYAFSGTPHLANFQTAIFYPGNILFLILSQIDAWLVMQILQFLFSGIFTFLLIRKLGGSILASLLGGISFSFCLFMVVWSQWNTVGQAALWLPLSLLAVEEMFLRRNSLKWLVIFVVSLTFSFFAGHIQTTLYHYLLTIAYCFYKIWDGKREIKILLAPIAKVLMGFVIVSILTAIQWLPTLELYLQAPRSYLFSSFTIGENLLLSPHLLTILVPNIFGNPATHNYFGKVTYIEAVSYFGTIPALLALFAIIWRKEKRVFFWTLIFFSGIVFSLKNPIAQFFYSLNLPVLGSSTPTRILFLTSFSGSILGALGLDSILEEIKKEKFLAKILVVAFILAFIYLLGWIWAIFFKETIALRNLVIPTLLFVFGLFVLLVRRKELLILILLITILDLFYYGTKITPFVSKNLVFPENEVFSFLKERGGIDRFFGFSGAYVDTNFATYYKVFNPEGYDPLFIGRYGELVSAGKNGRIKDKIPRSDVNFENVYPADSFAENRFRRRLFSLLGVKYIITKKEPLTEDLFNLISHGKNFDFYEYKEALPRFFLTGDYIVMKEPQQIIDNIMDKTFPLENTIILEEELPKEFTLPRKSSGKVRLISYRENEVLFEIEAFDNQLFFLSDNFYQGWVATINGERAKIYRANYTFRAVAISRGKHELLFTYQPWSLLQKDIQQSL